MKTEEDKEVFDFPTYTNDGVMEHMRALIDLKNIIARQLPKMPKEYITRLIMDRNHEAMLVVRRTGKVGKVIGGVVYRPFVAKEFVEIAFLAIAALEQMRGYGTRLMNKLKSYLQERSFKYIITYADNNAVDYFKKQGFSTKTRMPKDVWQGYIKDYELGSLMDCILNPDIDYNGIYDELKSQKEKLLTATKKVYHLKINSALDIVRKEGGIKRRRIEEDLISEKVFNGIPGIAESGWSFSAYKKSL